MSFFSISIFGSSLISLLRHRQPIYSLPVGIKALHLTGQSKGFDSRQKFPASRNSQRVTTRSRETNPVQEDIATFLPAVKVRHPAVTL